MSKEKKLNNPTTVIFNSIDIFIEQENISDKIASLLKANKDNLKLNQLSKLYDWFELPKYRSMESLNHLREETINALDKKFNSMIRSLENKSDTIHNFMLKDSYYTPAKIKEFIEWLRKKYETEFRSNGAPNQNKLLPLSADELRRLIIYSLNIMNEKSGSFDVEIKAYISNLRSALLPNERTTNSLLTEEDFFVFNKKFENEEKINTYLQDIAQNKPAIDLICKMNEWVEIKLNNNSNIKTTLENFQKINNQYIDDFIKEQDKANLPKLQHVIKYHYYKLPRSPNEQETATLKTKLHNFGSTLTKIIERETNNLGKAENLCRLKDQKKMIEEAINTLKFCPLKNNSFSIPYDLDYDLKNKQKSLSENLESAYVKGKKSIAKFATPHAPSFLEKLLNSNRKTKLNAVTPTF